MPEGFGLIVAPPKAGKSWMVAAVGLSCATGGLAFGCLAVGARPVLHMALEDGERRLQNRHRLLLGREAKPDAMHLIVTATPLTAPAIIAAFLQCYGSDCPLVIVDTLVRIRPQRKGADDPYQFDYLFASRLKGLLDGYPGAGLWAVHHARKALAEDFVAEGSGTYGLAGAADYVMVLRHPRLSMHGSLLVTGRDVPEGEYAVISDEGRGWRLDGDTLADAATKAQTQHEQARLGDRSSDVLAFVTKRGRTGARPADVAIGTGIDKAQVYTYLARLTTAGLLTKQTRGLYVNPVCCDGRVGYEEPEALETSSSHTTNTTPFMRGGRMTGPACTLCGEPCVCDQHDAHGQPAHNECQLRKLDPADRHHRLPKHPPTEGNPT